MNAETQLADLLQCAGLTVAAEYLSQLLRFLEELQRWNRTHNLTAVRDPTAALETHLVDSLTLLPFLPAGCSLLDFGSGGGLPGLPLRIARPDIRLTSLDAVAKKLAFQRHAARLLGLQDCVFVHSRLEDYAAHKENRESFSRIVFRAVGDVTQFAPLAAPLLAPGGLLVAMKGPEGEDDWMRCLESPLTDYRCRELVSLRLPRSGACRTLLLFEKSN